MTSFEWLAVVYFAVVAAAGSRVARSPRGFLYAAGAIVFVIVARFALPWAARAWLPHAYLILGYWIPAAFTPGPNLRFESWLQPGTPNSQLPTSNSQTRRLGRWALGVGSWNLGVGRWKLGVEILELAYLFCYLLVPAAFSVVWASGTTLDVERFWLAVLLAGYVCYGTLPWTAARPPRLMSIDPVRGGLARVNAHVLGRFSHQLVTFPSGHAAVSLASAVSVGRVAPDVAFGLGVVAVAIAVAAVAGRYHYVIDVLLGMLVGAVIPVVMGFVV